MNLSTSKNRLTGPRYFPSSCVRDTVFEQNVANAINEEVTLQEKLITVLDDETDTVHNRLTVATKHISMVMKSSGEWKWWCLIFFLVAGLIIVIAIAFKLL